MIEKIKNKINYYKQVIITIITSLLFMLLPVIAFAQSPVPAPMDSNGHQYIIFQDNNNGGRTGIRIFDFNSTTAKIVQAGVQFNVDDNTTSIHRISEGYYDTSTSQWVLSTINDDIAFIYITGPILDSTINIYNSDGSFFFKVPSLWVVQQAQLTELVRVLLLQFSSLLPMGLTVLAISLVVFGIIPRVLSLL